MHRFRRHSVTVFLFSLCAAGSAALANDVSTSFEFNDVDGEFTLGTPPNTATFLDGLAQTIGNLGLYRTGLNSWMIPAGMTGTINFETPAESIDLWFRDQFKSNDSVLTIKDTDGSTINTFDGTLSFANVNVTVDPLTELPIASIEFTNNGVSGWSVIDDFTMCASDVSTPIEDPIPASIQFGSVHVRLETIATDLTAPNWGTSAPGDTNNRLFVTDQDGTLWAIDLDTNTKSVFLDVSSRLVTLGIAGPGTFDERGLLGVAFHPDYQSNGLLYTYESHPLGKAADFSTIPKGEQANHQTVITEWNVPNPADGNSVVDKNSAREILRIDQPQFNHDGGALNFGPDDLLYIALGDGGAGDDQGIGHSPLPDGNGQDTTNILGSVIRIDPLGNNSANGQYGIPGDNPFVGARGGDVEEIWAFGLRNPFRFSFDQLTGELWLADAGQNDIEEVDVVTSGDNLGWPVKEGSFLFNPNGPNGGFVFEDSPGDPASMTDPIAQYDHDEGVVVIGGFVSRGTRIAPLEGQYVFGEFARTFNNDGRLFYLDDSNTILELNFVGQAELGLSLLGFGQDAHGEVYVMANGTGTPFQSTGVVLRLNTKPGDIDANGVVNLFDLLDMLDAWGACDKPCPPTCPADFTDSEGGDPDCTVNLFDLLLLLENWG